MPEAAEQADGAIGSASDGALPSNHRHACWLILALGRVSSVLTRSRSNLREVFVWKNDSKRAAGALEVVPNSRYLNSWSMHRGANGLDESGSDAANDSEAENAVKDSDDAITTQSRSFRSKPVQLFP